MAYKHQNDEKDLFGDRIDLGPAEHQPGHNEDLGLSLSGDEWEQIDQSVEERARRVSAEKRAAAMKPT